jgi:hypothetical protein
MKPMITGKALVVGVFAFLGLGPRVEAQQVFYNGASVFVEPGAHIYIQGGLTNQGAGQINNSGTITLTGDWENNASNNVFTPGGSGSVVLDGTTQSVQGTSPTHFARLTLANASVKSLAVNAVVTDSLNLADCELHVGNFQVEVTNPAVGAVAYTSGFVANDSIGRLVRATNSTSTYEFPMGSSQNVTRFRPIHIAPNASAANSYSVGFQNYNASNDSAFTFSAQAPACFVNDKWFHRISRPSGSSPADITFFYDNILDSAFQGLANWVTILGNWIDLGAVTAVNNASPIFSTITLNGHNNFTSSRYALTIKSIPSGMVATSPTTVCQGDTVFFQSTVPSPQGYDWVLNGVSLPITINGTPNLAATQAGSYALVANNGICTDTTAAIQVTLNALPNTAITAPPSLCASSSPVNLNAATPGGAWTGTGIVSASLGTFSPSASGVGAWAVVYSVTDVNNCSNADTVTVTVNALPDATFSFAPSYCLNAPAANLVPTVTGGTFSGPGISSVNLFTPSAAGVGSHTIQYVITDGAGCTDSSSNALVVNALPVVNISTPPSFCVNGTAQALSATPTGGTWTGTGMAGSNFDPAAVSGAGTYDVVYAFTDQSSNCSNTDTASIVVNALPDASFTAPGALCSNGQSVTLTPVVTGGTFSGSGVSSGGVFDPSASGAGTFPVSYQVTDGNNCSNSASQNLVVNAAPTVTIQPASGALCENGTSVSLNATPSGGTWTGTGIVGNQFFDPSLTGVGTFDVVYALTLNGCTGSDTTSLTVSPLPDASFTLPSPVCVSGGPVTMTPNVTGGTFSGTGVVNLNQFNPAVGPGSYNITYNVADPVSQCANSAVQSVTVESNPTASFVTNQIDNNNYDFDASASTGAGNFTWDFGDGNSGAGVTTSHTYAFGGEYVVILTVTNSCGSSVETFQIKVLSFANLDGNSGVNVFPNPFVRETNVEISMTESDNVTISVYDMLGRMTGRINSVALPAGTSVVTLKDEFFQTASSSYFIHVQNSKGETSVHQVVRMNH